MAWPEQAWSLTSSKGRGGPPQRTKSEKKRVMLRGDQLCGPRRNWAPGSPGERTQPEGKVVPWGEQGAEETL